MIESETIRLHYSITVLLMFQPFTTSWGVVIEVVMYVVLTTAITLVTTVLILCDNLYLLQIRIQGKLTHPNSYFSMTSLIIGSRGLLSTSSREMV